MDNTAYRARQGTVQAATLNGPEKGRDGLRSWGGSCSVYHERLPWLGMSFNYGVIRRIRAHKNKQIFKAAHVGSLDWSPIYPGSGCINTPNLWWEA